MTMALTGKRRARLVRAERAVQFPEQSLAFALQARLRAVMGDARDAHRLPGTR